MSHNCHEITVCENKIYILCEKKQQKSDLKINQLRELFVNVIISIVENIALL